MKKEINVKIKMIILEKLKDNNIISDTLYNNITEKYIKDLINN